MNIYADNNATSLVEPDHYTAVAEFLRRVDGNPSSIHARGRDAKVALEESRSHVCRMFGARTSELVFTSGATEANNILIQGLVQREALAGKRPHVIVSAIEHPAVLEPVRLLAERGLCEVTELQVQSTGLVDEQDLLSAMRDDTALVAIMHANNETGVVQPVERLAKAAKDRRPEVHFHTDAVQMIGKADISWYAAGPIDSASVSCHKIGGFKGVGALYLRNGTTLAPIFVGGGQERRRRPGTENLPGILSFGLIAKEMFGREQEFCEATQVLRDSFIEVLAGIDGSVVHCPVEHCLPNTVNFHIDGVPGEDILLNFDIAGIQISSGSACSSGANRPSHVLTALGYDDVSALNSLRVSFHPSVTHDGIRHMAKTLRETVERSTGRG